MFNKQSILFHKISPFLTLIFGFFVPSFETCVESVKRLLLSKKESKYNVDYKLLKVKLPKLKRFKVMLFEPDILKGRTAT